jgi:very-short-patch-repair endonuclease
MTPQELSLWRHLRTLRARGWRFRRQAPELGYILDFVCREASLVIEIDGSHHFENRDQVEHDAERDEALFARGLTILRFTNPEVDHALDAVLSEIDNALALVDPARHPSTAPRDDTLPFQGREAPARPRYGRLIRLGLRRRP